VCPPEFPEVLDGLADLCMDVGNGLPHFEAEGPALAGCSSCIGVTTRRSLSMAMGR
jgi:hypothetical protein